MNIRYILTIARLYWQFCAFIFGFYALADALAQKDPWPVVSVCSLLAYGLGKFGIKLPKRRESDDVQSR
jgi:apolipoprotein N-acyltransferase